jgi:hypothetical protein
MGIKHLYWILTGPSYAVHYDHFSLRIPNKCEHSVFQMLPEPYPQ